MRRPSKLDREPILQYDHAGQPTLLTLDARTAEDLRQAGYVVRTLGRGLYEARVPSHDTP